MYDRPSFAALVAIIGLIALADPGGAYAQIEGAVQYPPFSIGQDAQPPPPARMAPKIVLTRRLELGVSGSSLPPTTSPYWVQRAPLSGASPVPFPTGSGNN